MAKENYLKRYPVRVPGHVWSVERELVTLHLQNKGLFHRAAQLLFKRPRISHVKLDALGSLVWTLADGELNVQQIGKRLGEQFGDKAQPLYERLVSFLQTMEECRLIKWKK